uniref:TrmH family RNA methyltransferase n=1 Tax=Agathobacter sp. TaxID=2021311 RepID=UPI004055BA5D
MITSTANQQMKQLSALLKKPKERKNKRQFVAEGTKMVAEAPKESLYAVYVSESYEANFENNALCTELKQKAKIYEVVSDSVFKSISDTQTPQGILAIVSMPQYALEDLLKGEQTHLLILESVQDPGNLGTMVRTGEGAGITGIIMNKTTVDLFNPKTIRSTMGSIYRVPFFVTEDLEETLMELKQQGVSLYAAHLKGRHAYDEENYASACGFLIGNEGNGLSHNIADMADTYIKIPMEGEVESLNAAISATLLMYEANRQRRKMCK